jgi:hypothetical protein
MQDEEIEGRNEEDNHQKPVGDDAPHGRKRREHRENSHSKHLGDEGREGDHDDEPPGRLGNGKLRYPTTRLRFVGISIGAHVQVCHRAVTSSVFVV